MESGISQRFLIGRSVAIELRLRLNLLSVWQGLGLRLLGYWLGFSLVAWVLGVFKEGEVGVVFSHPLSRFSQLPHPAFDNQSYIW